MDHKQASEIIARYKAGTCTAEEKALLQNWVLYGEFDGLKYTAAEILADVKEIDSRIAAGTSSKARLWLRIAGLAATVTAIVFSIWFFSQDKPGVEYVQDIAPGGNRATLTIQGKTITLSNDKTGVVVGSDLKYSDGTQDPALAQAISAEGAESRVVTAATPKGGTYFIVLQDGTKAWLNADSKLEFLSSYTNKTQRVVKLTGEAYFEVAKALSPQGGGQGGRPGRVPFIVQTKSQTVEVLGTHFNINAYGEEPLVSTTLLEGSVAVRGNGNAIILKPNQQSTVADNGSTAVKQVDPSEALAWKSGRFVFNNTPMQVVMRQIARWYDVEVAYQDEDLKYKLLDGSVSRYENVSGILNAISQTGAARFKIDNHKIIVIK